ncbi:MAG: hypothetical protein ACTSU4_02925 [Promethearchaeota archaeon]
MESFDFSSFKEARRNFQYDYIFIDAIFYVLWVITLIKNRKWKALKAGLVSGFIVYFIDAIWWWNMPAGKNYPVGTYVREYWIGGIKMPHPLGSYFWLKFWADFMMCFSYSMFMFAWLWIVLDNYKEKNLKSSLFYSFFLFGAWLVTPFLSQLLPLDDTVVNTVRHMDTQFTTWIVNVIIGYSILSILYVGGIKVSREPRILGLVFLVGCLGSFFMEFPLFLSGIRPTGISFLLFEVVFLFNQGAPYLYLLHDKILPFLGKKLGSRG